MTEREALKLALEALEVANSCVDGYYIPKGKTQLPEVEEAITAIKEALAQPEQEFVCSTGLCHYRKPPQFPTMLRKMWSGTEVQEWINENWSKT